VVEIGATLGWRVTVADHRPAYADPARFPRARRVLLTTPPQMQQHVDLARFDAAVIMSHHIATDLAALGATVRAMHAGNVVAGERWLALGDTFRRFDVPLAPLLDLLDGVAMDLDEVRNPNFASLQRYCRLVAGGVGLMLGPVLGATSARFREPGIGLGVAMQLTNVLRDVAEDLDAGRVYLPVDELARFGVDRATLERRQATPEFVALMRFQITRTRTLFAAADPVVGLFPQDGSRLTVRLLQRTYAGILDGIERLGYDVFRARAYVSAPRKLMILGRAVWSELPLRSA